MALTRCVDCAGKVSTTAQACPHCGITAVEAQKKQGALREDAKRKRLARAAEARRKMEEEKGRLAAAEAQRKMELSAKKWRSRKEEAQRLLNANLGEELKKLLKWALHQKQYFSKGDMLALGILFAFVFFLFAFVFFQVLALSFRFLTST